MKTFLITIKTFIFIIAVFTIQLDCVANTENVHIKPQLKQPFMTGLDVLLENEMLTPAEFSDKSQTSLRT